MAEANSVIEIGPLQPFLTVAADGYEVLHGLGQVFILVVYQAEMALEFKIWQGELDEAARFDFVLDQAAGQDGEPQVGHDGFLDGFRIVIDADDLTGQVVCFQDALKEIPRAASLFADEDGQAIQVLWRCNGLAAPFAVRRGDESQIIRKDGAGYEIRRLDPSFDEGQVQFVFDQELLQLFRVVDGRQDRPVRPRPAAIRQELHQEDVADGDARAQADRQ